LPPLFACEIGSVEVLMTPIRSGSKSPPIPEGDAAMIVVLTLKVPPRGREVVYLENSPETVSVEPCAISISPKRSASSVAVVAVGLWLMVSELSTSPSGEKTLLMTVLGDWQTSGRVIAEAVLPSAAEAA